MRARSMEQQTLTIPRSATTGVRPSSIMNSNAHSGSRALIADPIDPRRASEPTAPLRPSGDCIIIAR
ncbi:MAG: hypothetical protein BWY99_02166 [Synergistetes bacterium ADurb.BinA166]|nr:MAG: hypothetical protein BWY99_02166 [Synergistetes bacterium ADurb.BinA166]